MLMPRVGSLHGVDISEEMLAKARVNVPTAAYSWYDGEKLPFTDETFDVRGGDLRSSSRPGIEPL